jgi:flagellar motor component MotA
LFVGAILLAFAAAHGLMAAGLSAWASYLIIGVLVCIGGGIAVILAINRFKAATPVAEKSLEALEEDAKWLKNPK